MAIQAVLHRNPNILYLKDYPGQSIPYRKKEPSNIPSVRLRVTDSYSQEKFDLFVTQAALRRIGLSANTLVSLSNQPENLSKFLELTDNIKERLQVAAPILAQHLDPAYLSFVQKNIFQTTRLISRHLLQKTECLVREKGFPKIYFSEGNVIIHLQGLQPLGSGTFGRAKKAALVTAEESSGIMIVKKVINKEFEEEIESNRQHLQKEIDSLKEFTNQRGIVQMLGSGNFEGNPVLFMSMYDCDLYAYFGSPFPLSLNQRLEAASQLLDGLKAIFLKEGIHGDLSLGNVFLRRRDGKVEFVIGDFGSFRKIGEEKWGMATIRTGSPEYHLQKTVSHKQDVWALGTILFRLCTGTSLPCFTLELPELQAWLATLKPGWIEAYLPRYPTPPFFLTLMNDILDPRPEFRPTAEEAFQRFSEGLAAFLANSNEAPVSKKRKTSSEPEM